MSKGPTTLVPGSLACVGITKDTSTDVVYAEVKRNYREAHSGLSESCPYQLFGTKAFSIPSGLQRTFPTVKEYREQVIIPIQQSINELNKKRSQLFSLLMKNPHNSITLNCVRRVDIVFGPISSWLMSSEGLSALLGYTLALPLLFVWVTVILFVGTLALPFDIILCKCRNSGNPKEIEFLNKLTEEHPELDTFVLDEEARTSLEAIISNLQLRFPSLYIYFYSAVEKVRDAGSDNRYHDEERFAIVFDTKPKADDNVNDDNKKIELVRILDAI